jgi:adenosylcobinamide-GDP ribazoletransferase
VTGTRRRKAVVLDRDPGSGYAARRMGLGQEMRAAVGCLTALGPPANAPRDALAGGLAFYPVVGLALGGVAAAVASAVGLASTRAAGPAGVLALVLVSGGRGTCALAATTALLRRGAPSARLARLRDAPTPAGVALAAAVLALRAVATAVLPAPARTTALLLAPMLGAWAIVVQCYGGTPAHARGVAAALVGHARFREFGWASVVALGVTLATGEAIGLVVVLAASLTTVGVRVFAHRRIGGLTGRLLWATRELVETAVLGILALVAGILGTRLG